MDRIELGTQSLKEYRGFADESEDVQATENTGVLVTKLKSINPADTLIVTSIQKMSNIKDEAEGGLKTADIELMNSKRLVFIVDECHRSTFGDMLLTIKHTFPKAIFFGFTGTPIQEENQKKMNTTATVFGDELHRYSIADGIRDKNVLGFDPYMVLTYRDTDLREAVALEKAKASTVDGALADPSKSNFFYKYRNLPMVRVLDHNIRAFLSDRYRRLDHLELCSAVLPVIQEMKGAEITSCDVTDAHLYLKVINRKLKEEVAVGDVVQAGFVISNSEIGLGSLRVEPLVFRLVCKNGLIIKDYAQKKYHESPDRRH